MHIFKEKKFIISEFFLCFILGFGIIFYAQSTKEGLQKQDTLLYNVNMSGKQSLLAQRIVFLSQIVVTNRILNRSNPESLTELRSCIEQLNSIHRILQSFVVSTIVGNEKRSTLDEMYFGGGNLNFKMEEFLNSANKIFFLQSAQDAFRINQELLHQLEDDDGLLASLELATLSHQFYAQNIIKESQLYLQILLYAILSSCGLQILLFLWALTYKYKD
ncbi:hypothetical protein [Helicobacter rodentium]|uniref:hypothetical protein n=1 Tax=Helicobacter rodentium TaxID=59617 RepID=UPI0025B7758E|nr:hypothetical protein [Helicobacter rodentium]